MKTLQKMKSRKLSFEALESRELLSVSAADFSSIRDQYADLNLSANMNDYNVIEITAAQLSYNSLENALLTAKSSAKNDLIVVRTTASQDSIDVTSTFEIYEYLGSTTIVSLGTNKLTLSGGGNNQLLYAYDTTLLLGGIDFIGGYYNSSWFGGGGAAIEQYDSNVTITECDFIANTVFNSSPEGGGGAIYSEEGQLKITHSTFAVNTTIGTMTSYGGAINVHGSKVVIDNVDFLENSVLTYSGYAQGGALFLGDVTTATVTNTTFKGNSAYGGWGAYGGGCYTLDTNATFTNVLFVGNKADSDPQDWDYPASVGGGMAQSGGTVYLTNVTITGNYALEYGAGYYIDGVNSDSSYAASTPGITYVRNSIIALNTGHNQQFHTSRGGTAYKQNSIETNPSFVQNPGAIGSKNYGDLHLKSGSGAINKGNNSYVSGVTTDLDGLARINGGTVDLGAYEYGSTLPAPSNFRSTSQVGTSVTLAWNAQSNITGYKLEYKKSSDSNWTTFSPAPSASSTSAVLNGLVANTAYQFRLAAVSKSLTSVYTAIVTVTTKVDPPATPANFRSTAQASNSITLAWNTASNATGYKVEYKKSSDSNWSTFSPAPSASATTVTVTGLTVNTDYQFRLAATNAGGSSAYAAVVNASTKLASPANFKSTTQTDTSLNVSWSAVPNATNYVLQYKSVSVSSWSNVSFSGTSANITGLNADKEYHVRIQATGAGGAASDYVEINVITKPTSGQPTPKNLRAITVGQNTVEFDWSDVEGATSYVFEQKTNSDITWTTYNTTNSKYTVENLTANTTYSYRVKADGSDYSDIITVTTLPTTEKDIPIVMKAEINSIDKKVDLEWSNLGGSYEYYIFNNGTLISQTAQSANSYTGTSAVANNRYQVFAYDKNTMKYSNSLQIVLSTEASSLEIVNHSVTSQGGITLNWDINAGQFAIFRNDAKLAEIGGEQSWTDKEPIEGENRYVVYAYTPQGWKYTSSYVVNHKSASAAPAAIPNTSNTFWSTYDLNLLEDVLTANI
jgi:hypothetical protein